MSSISRPAHVLKREKTLTIPRYFIFFDTETTQYVNPDKSVQQRLKMGWVCYYQRPYGQHREHIDWFYFESPSAFWEFVYRHAQPKQRLWIIARNIVFDFTVVKGWNFLRREGYRLKFFHNNGVSVIVAVVKGNKSIVFLDSMNWFTESLAETGKRIGLPKLKIDFDTCTKEELSIYCRNDVLIEFENFRYFIRFLESNIISRLCYTKASTAMAAYLFRHYHTPIYIHNNYEAIKLERDSYKGGRCECFYLGDLGDENYYILDVNSLYPFVMRNNLYPTKYIKILHNVRVEDLGTFLNENSVVAKVRVETDEPVYALKTDRTIFPIGTFETTLCTPELKYALEHNHIKDVLDVVVYEQASIFVSYVDTMYRLRRDFATAGVSEYEKLCKVLLNSLYGKFGQKAENWVKVGDVPNEPDREELIFYTNPRRIMRLRYLLGEVFELKSYGESFNSFPAISAHVTAYARMYLWSLMSIAGVGNYFYCDTDSLIVNEVGLCNLASLMSDTELGKLKLQETGTHLIIRGLKDYETSSKIVIKGVRKNAVQLSRDSYQQQRWPSFKGLLKSGDVNNYTVTTVTKELSRAYTKGIVDKTGQVRPFESYEQDGMFLSELVPIKKLITELEEQILRCESYQIQIQAQDVRDREIGLGGLYYVPKKFRGEVKHAIGTYPDLAFRITYDITKGGTEWSKAVQEGLLQRTGGTWGNMDVSDFLDRLGQALQSRELLGKLNKKALMTLQNSDNLDDKVLATKYIMLLKGHTANEINTEIKGMLEE